MQLILAAFTYELKLNFAVIDAAVSYTDGNEDDNLIVPQDRLQRRVPVSQDNEDLVVKGACCKGFCTGHSTMIWI